MKSLVAVQDSIYIGFLSSWYELPTPDQIEYSWFANGQKIPVMQIITQNIGGTETISTIKFKDKKRYFASVEENCAFKGMIYPNPATDELNINFQSASSKIEIFDISGQKVYSQEISTLNTQINIEDWDAGIYILKSTDENGISTAKFIVQ